jgi:hypothetical protein
MDWLGSTPETMITGDPTSVLERSWPAVPPGSDAEKRAVAMFMSEASRARVIQSDGMFGAVSLEQDALKEQELAIVTAAIADPTLLIKFNATLMLIQSMCLRLGNITMAIAAHGQLTAHDAQRHAHEVESQQQLFERFLTRLEDLLAAAPQRPGTSVG